MKNLICAVGLVLFACSGAAAQQGTTGTQEKHQCIMADRAVWTDLGLNEDQLARVQTIQANCDREYKANIRDTEMVAGSVSRHTNEIRNVLTPEQYAAWSEWCSSREPLPKISAPR